MKHYNDPVTNAFHAVFGQIILISIGIGAGLVGFVILLGFLLYALAQAVT